MGFDQQRAGAAFGHPGIDPRKWVQVAWVKKVAIDPDHGPIVDVELLNEQIITVRQGSLYAAGGVGFYYPLELDDKVLVHLPEGTDAAGGWIVGMCWEAADKPPAVMVDHPRDSFIILKPGANLRIVTSGGGEVLIGASDAAHTVIRGDVFLPKYDGHRHFDSQGGLTSKGFADAVANDPAGPGFDLDGVHYPPFNPGLPPSPANRPTGPGDSSASGADDVSPNVKVS